MNKKQLIVAAIATVMSVSGAHAVSNISGVTNGGNGPFDIRPEQINGDVGYRYYDQFILGQGDVANLIYQGIKSGEIRDLNTFINLVNNQVQINGLLNALKSDGTGHAVFISPKGMVVGASGVLNVGTLSVVTPTQTDFNKMHTEYGKADFSTINNISTMRNGAGNNYGGNAEVDIQGKILARNGVDIRGSQVNVSGGIVNGYKGTNIFSTATQASNVFDQLVNTNGITANASQIANNNGRIVIKSGAGTGGINISGKVASLNNTETAITNHGSAGLTVAGQVFANGKLNLYNNNTASALTVSGKLANKNADLSLSSKGGVDVQAGANIKTDNNLEIVNHNGALKFAGTAVSKGKTDIVNYGTNSTISGYVGDTNTTSVRIVNENGKLTFTGRAIARDSVSLRNSGTQGMDIGGTVKAGEGVLVHNKAGNATLRGAIEVEDGNVAVYNQGTGKLTTVTGSSITNGQGNVAIKNEATGGMELNGNITNEGEIAINNLAGYAKVNGTINNTGNIGVINKDNGTGLTIGATINNEGKIKLVNSTGTNGLTVDGTVNNAGGDLYVYNDAGHTTINGTLNNTEAGNLYVLSRKASTGITTATNSVITNEAGNLAIKHNGSGTKNGVGMNLNGKVANDGEIAINNYTGNMNVAGEITQNGNATIGIINRTASEDRAQTGLGGNAMTVNAAINGGNINLKNNGSGDMTVNGEITHNGRLNILGNEGKLILGGKIHNTGTDMTYAASRAQGDGIDVKSTFNADANNGGTILIKNITGENGLNYAGTMTSNGQAEIYNKVGDMTVTGAINAAPAVILNTGRNLTVTDDANLQGDVKIVNKGTEKATVADKYKNNFREQTK